MEDYARWYEKVSAPFRSESARKAVVAADKALVAVVAVGYLAALGALAAWQDPRALRFALVPAVTFAVVTIARAAVNAPRPYEAFPIDPIVRKDTSGKSMPSRHMASGTVIAFAFAWLGAPAGIAAFCACAAVAFTRIVGGVHFPRDIAVAVLVAAAFGIAGFFVIP